MSKCRIPSGLAFCDTLRQVATVVIKCAAGSKPILKLSPTF